MDLGILNVKISILEAVIVNPPQTEKSSVLS